MLARIALLFALAALISCQGAKELKFDYRALDQEHGKNLVADVDNDGINDIVTLKTGEDGAMVWYKADGEGVRAKNVIWSPVYFRGDRAETADVDGDGDLDLVAGLREGEELFACWLRNPLPDGDPSEAGSWALAKIGYQGVEKEGHTSYIKDIVVADFDRDGAIDVATRTNTRTRVFFQLADLAWSEPVILDHDDHEGMDGGDMDADGDMDLVLNGFWYETPDDPRVQPFVRHDIDEKWFNQTEGSWRDDNASVKVADVTGDGLPDVLISHSEKPGFPISLYSAASPAQVKADEWQEIHVAEVFDFCQSLDAGDLDNDGDVDVFAAKFERDHSSEQWRNEPPYPLVIYLNMDGKGTQWQPFELSQRGMYAGIVGDVDSDGDLDVLGPRSYWTGPTDLYQNLLADD